MVIGADCHNVEGNQGEVCAALTWRWLNSSSFLCNQVFPHTLSNSVQWHRNPPHPCSSRWYLWHFGNWTTMNSISWHTLFSKRNAHWFCPVLPLTPGHWPQPRVMSSLSNGLWSNMQKTPFKNSQDHLTKLKWPQVGVSDLGTSEN